MTTIEHGLQNPDSCDKEFWSPGQCYRTESVNYPSEWST